MFLSLPVHAALRETEKAHGLKYVDRKLPRGSMLLQASFAVPQPATVSFSCHGIIHSAVYRYGSVL